MPIKSKNVFIVKCDREIFEKVFIKKKNSEIINRGEIFQKLTNKDIDKSPPSEEIVDFHVIKKLNSFRECKRTEFVFYLVEQVNDIIIETLHEHLETSHVPVFFHLLVDSVVDETMIEKFSSIQKIEYDKISDFR